MAPTPVILISCGSYNPPTNMHLRMFEIARDHLHRMGTHVVVGGVISPVHDTYTKKGLANSMHRCSMLRLALQNSDWIRLSTWESRQNTWTRTRICLQHHQNLLNSMLSNDVAHHLQIEDTEWIPENVKNNSDNMPIQIKLLCGADLLESFGVPDLWSEEDMNTIVGEYGLVVITREGSNPSKFIYNCDILYKHMHNICIVTEWILNEISSTKIRRALKRSESVRYLLQDSVIDYIYKHEIYDVRTPDTTIKLELPSPNANNYLHIDPQYLTAFLTPSPSDITMDSPSPIEIAASIDMRDAVVLRKNLQNAGGEGDNRLDETREQLINNTISYNADNGNVKHVAKVAYPGQAKQIIANKIGITRIVEVGPFDEPITKLRSDPLSEEDHRSVENIVRDKIKIQQKQVSDLSSKTVTSNIDLDSNGDREIIVKILPDLSNSSELVSNEDHRFVLESNVKDKETLDLKSKAEIASIGLDSCETVVKIQSDQSISKEMLSTENCKTVIENMIKDKTEVEQREILKSKTNIANIDSGSNTDSEIIVKVQPGPSNTSEMILKEAHKSTVKSIAMDKIEIGQKEILDLRSKTKSANINLGLTEDGEMKQIQSSQSSTELRLRECCWPIRENTADDKIEIYNKNIISTKEIFHTGLYLDDSSIVASKKMIDNESTNQFNLNKIEPEKNSTLIAKEKDDASSKETNVKREIANVKLNSVETDNVVKVQPAHSSHNIIITKEGNHGLMAEKLTDAKITSEEKKNRYKEDLKLTNADENGTISAKLDLEKIMESNVKIDDMEINFKKEIADFGSDKIKDPRTTLNISPASLDGRYECTLSDFNIDKEDYRLSLRSNEEGEKEKFLHTAESSLTKHVDDQYKDLTDTTDSINDNKISAKKDDIQSGNSQVLINAAIQSYEGKADYLTTEEINNRAKSVEETHQSRFTEQRLSLEIEIDDKVDMENRERIKILEEITRTGDTEKAPELDAHSSERRAISYDPNLEIDGKYLKSIVNSRKSPRKIKDGQVYDIDNKEQYQIVTDNQQVLQVHQQVSEEFQSPSTKVKISEKLEKNHVSDANIDVEKNDRIIDNQEMFHMKEIFQDSSKIVSTKIQSIKKVDEFHINSQNKHEFKNQDKSINDREVSNVLQNSPRSISTKARSFKETDKFQTSESEREFQHQDKSISDREMYLSEKASQKSSRTSSIKSPGKMKKSQIIYRSNEMKDYDRSINDRVISQLEEVFQDLSKKPLAKLENPKVDHENYIEMKKQNRSIDNREASRSEELPQKRLSKTSSMKSPKKIQEQKSVKMSDEKEQRGQEKIRETRSVDVKTKLDFNEIKDVYTRKVRRYNVPLQGSLDSMIVSDESNVQKPKKDDAFSKKSKSYESIKRIQEVFLGVPSKANSSGSQLDIPDEFCSICCYMNEITFRTEEEISSPNQETFYTLRSACSSLGDDDDSIECDICESLNLQEPIDDLDGKVQEIPCELCRICSEVDGSYEQNSALPPDRYAFKVVESQRDDDDSFEIENCGFQSGTESADDRSKISEKEKIKEGERPKSQSLFIHDSSMVRDQPRELYFIPKDEIAILTSGARKIGRKGSLFRKKEDFGGSARDNRRYSSVDSLQLAKISSKANDKMLKTTKDPTLVGSADNLISRDSRRSKSLQRSADNVKCLNSSADNLMENLRKENEANGSVRKSSIRDKEAVKMILTQHGIKIISEKETAL